MYTPEDQGVTLKLECTVFEREPRAKPTVASSVPDMAIALSPYRSLSTPDTTPANKDG